MERIKWFIGSFTLIILIGLTIHSCYSPNDPDAKNKRPYGRMLTDDEWEDDYQNESELLDSGKKRYEKLEHGSFVKLLDKSISTNGGKVIVKSSESDIDGMTIEAFKNAYKKQRRFKISTAEIKNHKLGSKFKPIAPLIRVENGGGYSEGLTFIRVPIQIEEDEIAAAFFYDDKKNTLEPIPVTFYSTNEIVFSSRHFQTNVSSADEIGYQGEESKPKVLLSSFSRSSNNSTKEKMKSEEDRLYSNIVISSVKEKDLIAQKVIKSGFKPGTDDWEFPNYGTCVEPKGCCDGHSISALWYYKNVKFTKKQILYGRYSLSEGLWQDNPLGLKLTSITQREGILYSKKIYDDFYKYLSKPNDDKDYYKEYHKIAWKAACAQMYISGNPLYTVLITIGQENKGAHAVIAYKIDYPKDSMDTGKIYLADPNFPGDKNRNIIVKKDTLQPYFSGEKAPIENIKYTLFQFFGMSAMYNWDNMSDRWKKFKKGTIGNDDFPNVEYKYKIGENEGISTLVTNIPFNTEVPIYISCHVIPRDSSAFDGKISIYVDGKRQSTNDGDDEKWAELNMIPADKGKKLGIYVFKSGSDGKKWIDFKWVDTYALGINPHKLKGKANEKYTWEAIIDIPLSNARYEWDFGDGSSHVSVINDKKVSHTYSKGGVYPILLRLYDSNGQFINVATTYAEIMVEAELIVTPKSSKGPPGTIFDLNASVEPEGNYLFVWEQEGQKGSFSDIGKTSNISLPLEEVGEYKLLVKLYSLDSIWLDDDRVTITVEKDKVVEDKVTETKTTGHWVLYDIKAINGCKTFKHSCKTIKVCVCSEGSFNFSVRRACSKPHSTASCSGTYTVPPQIITPGEKNIFEVTFKRPDSNRNGSSWIEGRIYDTSEGFEINEKNGAVNHGYNVWNEAIAHSNDRHTPSSNEFIFPDNLNNKRVLVIDAGFSLGNFVYSAKNYYLYRWEE